MNAVKRCLALFAATLVVGACSGDPTADDAGANPTIRATPGAVWLRDNTTATIIIEAVDKLGGPVEGSWTAGTPAGPFTVVVDPTYRPTSTGAIGTATKFIVTPTAEGEGSIVFSGTGGDITVPIRVAPDTNAFNVTFSNLTPAVAEVVTATAPAGIRFTSGTEIRFYDGPLPLDSADGLARPTITGMSSDSTQLSFLPAPGATGQVRFTGIAAISMPSLTTTARSAQTVTVPPLSSVAATFSNGAPAVNTPVTVTMPPANFKLRPTSTFSALARTGIVQSIAADSLSAIIIPIPGNNGPVNISGIKFAPLPSLSVTLPTVASLNVPAAPNLGQDDRTLPGFGSFTATLTNGQTTGFYDQMTLGSPDRIPNGQGGGFPNQWIELVITNSGTYTVSLDWLGTTTDLDLFVVNQAGTTRLATAASLARPEVATGVVLAAGTYWIAFADFETGGTWVQVTIRRTA